MSAGWTKKSWQLRRNHYTNYSTLVQWSPLLFCPHMGVATRHWLRALIESRSADLFGHAPSTEAGQMAGFSRIGYSTHGPSVGRFLLIWPMLLDIRPMCARLKLFSIFEVNNVKCIKLIPDCPAISWLLLQGVIWYHRYLLITQTNLGLFCTPRHWL